MKCLIVGASAGLGRALAEHLAAAGHDLFLVATDERDLAATAAHLSLLCGVHVSYAATDLADVDAAALRQQVLSSLGSIEALFYVAGLGVEEDRGQLPDRIVERLVAVNFLAGVRIVNAFLPDLAARRTAWCVGVGSVAAVRGRGSNMVYGASKRGLEFYFEALRHHLRDTACTVQFYRLGYMSTAMLAGRARGPLPAAELDEVARRIVADMARGGGMRYLPRWWFYVCTAVRLLPWSLFKRASF